MKRTLITTIAVVCIGFSASTIAKDHKRDDGFKHGNREYSSKYERNRGSRDYQKSSNFRDSKNRNYNDRHSNYSRHVDRSYRDHGRDHVARKDYKQRREYYRHTWRHERSYYPRYYGTRRAYYTRFYGPHYDRYYNHYIRYHSGGVVHIHEHHDDNNYLQWIGIMLLLNEVFDDDYYRN